MRSSCIHGWEASERVVVNFGGNAVTEWIDRWQYAALRLRRLWHRELEQVGIVPNSFEILAAIHRFSDQGCSQKDLANLIVQSESNICGLIDKLVNEGSISRTRSLTDRRKWILKLSVLGDRLLSEMDSRRQRWLGQEFPMLSAMDCNKTSIARLLALLAAASDEEPPAEEILRFERGEFPSEGVAA